MSSPKIRIVANYAEWLAEWQSRAMAILSSIPSTYRPHNKAPGIKPGMTEAQKDAIARAYHRKFELELMEVGQQIFIVPQGKERRDLAWYEGYGQGTALRVGSVDIVTGNITPEERAEFLRRFRARYVPENNVVTELIRLHGTYNGDGVFSTSTVAAKLYHFNQAVALMKAGYPMRRQTWNGIDNEVRWLFWRRGAMFVLYPGTGVQRLAKQGTDVQDADYLTHDFTFLAPDKFDTPPEDALAFDVTKIINGISAFPESPVPADGKTDDLAGGGAGRWAHYGPSGIAGFVSGCSDLELYDCGLVKPSCYTGSTPANHTVYGRLRWPNASAFEGTWRINILYRVTGTSTWTPLKKDGGRIWFDGQGRPYQQNSPLISGVRSIVTEPTIPQPSSNVVVTYVFQPGGGSNDTTIYADLKSLDGSVTYESNIGFSLGGPTPTEAAFVVDSMVANPGANGLGFWSLRLRRAGDPSGRVLWWKDGTHTHSPTFRMVQGTSSATTNAVVLDTNVTTPITWNGFLSLARNTSIDLKATAVQIAPNTGNGARSNIQVVVASGSLCAGSE